MDAAQECVSIGVSEGVGDGESGGEGATTTDGECGRGALRGGVGKCAQMKGGRWRGREEEGHCEMAGPRSE